MKFTRPLKDYKGYKLCDPCWNGKHWHNEIITTPSGMAKRTNHRIADCLGEPCECPCKQLMNERRPRVKPDHSLQMGIDMTNPIQIGQTKTHKDE